MDKTQNENRRTKPDITSFLGCCFGYSDQKSPETIRSDAQKKARWFSWSRFRLKKSASSKTVPVEPTLSEKAKPTLSEKTKPISNVPASKSKSEKLKSKPQARVATSKPPSRNPVQVPVPSDQTHKDKPQKTPYGSARNSLERREHSDRFDTSKEYTWPKRPSFRRKLESMRNGSSQPGSPNAKPKPGRLSRTTHSGPLPVPVHDKGAANPSSLNPRATWKKPEQEKEALGKKRDPLVGLSVIMVILIIMVFWGRLCAILCTSAWFYFVPRLSNATKLDKQTQNSLDQYYDSEEYKKKVVLEGFLERNHRNSL